MSDTITIGTATVNPGEKMAKLITWCQSKNLKPPQDISLHMGKRSKDWRRVRRLKEMVRFDPKLLKDDKRDILGVLDLILEMIEASRVSSIDTFHAPIGRVLGSRGFCEDNKNLTLTPNPE